MPARALVIANRHPRLRLERRALVAAIATLGNIMITIMISAKMTRTCLFRVMSKLLL
jgi:hypothetical protein